MFTNREKLLAVLVSVSMITACGGGSSDAPPQNPNQLPIMLRQFLASLLQQFSLVKTIHLRQRPLTKTMTHSLFPSPINLHG